MSEVLFQGVFLSSIRSNCQEMCKNLPEDAGTLKHDMYQSAGECHDEDRAWPLQKSTYRL